MSSITVSCRWASGSVWGSHLEVTPFSLGYSIVLFTSSCISTTQWPQWDQSIQSSSGGKNILQSFKWYIVYIEIKWCIIPFFIIPIFYWYRFSLLLYSLTRSSYSSLNATFPSYLPGGSVVMEYYSLSYSLTSSLRVLSTRKEREVIS